LSTALNNVDCPENVPHERPAVQLLHVVTLLFAVIQKGPLCSDTCILCNECSSGVSNFAGKGQDVSVSCPQLPYGRLCLTQHAIKTCQNNEVQSQPHSSEIRCHPSHCWKYQLRTSDKINFNSYRYLQIKK